MNTKGSWADRPDATTRIPNLMLAADYVRTYTDLATMEGANEAARRAVNGDPRRDAVARARAASCGRCASRPRCRPARTLDKLLWRLRRPPSRPACRAPRARSRPGGPLGRAALAAARESPGSVARGDGLSARSALRGRRERAATPERGSTRPAPKASGQRRPAAARLRPPPPAPGRLGVGAQQRRRAAGEVADEDAGDAVRLGLARGCRAVVANATRRPSAEIDGSVA